MEMKLLWYVCGCFIPLDHGAIFKSKIRNISYIIRSTFIGYQELVTGSGYNDK